MGKAKQECTIPNCTATNGVHSVHKVPISPETKRQFCPRCFADDRNGSWGDGVYGTESTGSLCANCGASNCAIEMPEWAVKFIREQASWVGKRYYPHEEDIEFDREIKYLRGIAPIPAGITAEASHHGQWTVRLGDTAVFPIIADTEAEAIEQGRLSLPYPVPA